jgi:hypothetical protein
MIDEIIKKIISILLSSKKTFLYPPNIKSSNLEGK